jgi:hypothetical protein
MVSFWVACYDDGGFLFVAVDLEALVQCWRLLSLSGYEAQDNI